MRYLYTDNEARAIDTHAITQVGVPALILMEKAAMSVASLIMEKKRKETKIGFVCGMGNNGGDGMAAARILSEEGYDVSVTLVGSTEKMTESMKKQTEIAIACGVSFVSVEEMRSQRYEMLVDGLFGVGLSREVTDVYETVIAWINESGAEVLSLDIPSGISGATGRVMGIAVRADATITFGVNKLGLVLYPGCEYAGEVVVANIGFPRQSVAAVTSSQTAFHYEVRDIPERLPKRIRYSNKGNFGKVLIVAGSETMAGACLLAAKAAYVMGAGLVKVCTKKGNRDVIWNGLPEALYSEMKDLEEAIAWADAIVAGPGIGRGSEAEKIIHTVARQAKVPLVIDADGLYALKNQKDIIPANTILTPHLKELSMFMDIPVEQIKRELLHTARETARQQNVILVEKDARTVVSDGISCYVNVTGNEGMATGGSGDVLAGMIGGLLATGLKPYEAAKLGVYIHGMAGDMAKKQKSSYSMLASDIITGIGEVLAKMDEI